MVVFKMLRKKQRDKEATLPYNSHFMVSHFYLNVVSTDSVSLTLSL